MEEGSGAKIGVGGAARTIVEERLWRKDDERFAKVTLDLTSQDVEKVGGSAAVCHLKIHLLGVRNMILGELFDHPSIQ